MPSGSDDTYDIGQTYQDLVRAEQTASELESRLDNLDSQLEDLIRASNIPPELFDADDETLRRILEAASANTTRRAEEEAAPSGGSGGATQTSSSNPAPTDVNNEKTNGTEGEN